MQTESKAEAGSAAGLAGLPEQRSAPSRHDPDRPGSAAPRPQTGAPDRSAAAKRLGEVDALRGLAALAVVLYHYTTRFAELYSAGRGAAWSFPLGHHGVDLFFIVSGFVIFMTLQRTRRPMDFVVSRFSRLYPAFWAAVLLTFGITHWLGLPGRTVDAASAAANLTMLHSFFGIASVDGVYWTLEIELLFYGWMFSLHRLGWLDRRVHAALAGFLALELVRLLGEQGLGLALPWTVTRYLMLQTMPWFVLGVCVFLLLRPRVAADRPRSLALGLAAVAVLGAAQGWPIALLALALSGLVWAAASGRLPWLGHPVLVWLGAISYTLYLLHQYIGWSLQLQLIDRGWTPSATVPVALGVSLLLASALTYGVEQPAMARIRQWWKQRQPA